MDKGKSALRLVWLSCWPNNTKGEEYRHDDCAINPTNCQESFRNVFQRYRELLSEKLPLRYVLGTRGDSPRAVFLIPIQGLLSKNPTRISAIASDEHARVAHTTLTRFLQSHFQWPDGDAPNEQKERASSQNILRDKSGSFHFGLNIHLSRFYGHFWNRFSW